MRVLITGASGMVGSSILKTLKQEIKSGTVFFPSRVELNLCDQENVRQYLYKNKFDYVIHCAAKVGGIKANMLNPSDFLYENSMMGAIFIHECYKSGVVNFVNIGSSCMYPKDYADILKEEDLLAGPLEPTNEAFSLAKIAAAKLCQYLSQQYGVTYKTFIPSSMYGPGDHYDLDNSHLVGAAISKLCRAKKDQVREVEIWGNGQARREFLYVDDFAGFVVSNLRTLNDFQPYTNVGSGYDLSITEYYEKIAKAINYEVSFVYNTDKPTGMMKKLLSNDKVKALSWKPKTSLEVGLRVAIDDFLSKNNFC
jgi:GDP-L-fucose synthase